MSKQVGCTPTSSIGELYTLVALCASMLCGNPYSLHSFDCKAFSCLTVTFSALQAFLPFDLPNPPPTHPLTAAAACRPRRPSETSGRRIIRSSSDLLPLPPGHLLLQEASSMDEGNSFAFKP